MKLTGALAAGEHSVVNGTLPGTKGQGKFVLACCLTPRGLVVGVEKVSPPLGRGARGGGLVEPGEARAARLPCVCSL